MIASETLTRFPHQILPKFLREFFRNLSEILHEVPFVSNCLRWFSNVFWKILRACFRNYYRNVFWSYSRKLHLKYSTDISWGILLEYPMQIPPDSLSKNLYEIHSNLFPRDTSRKSSMGCFLKSHMGFLQRKSYTHCFSNFSMNFFTCFFWKYSNLIFRSSARDSFENFFLPKIFQKYLHVFLQMYSKDAFDVLFLAIAYHIPHLFINFTRNFFRSFQIILF